MKYTYAYKTSDGKRHEATMDAASREEVFSTLRARGIKAIKVVAGDGSKANGESAGHAADVKSRRRRRISAVVTATVVVFAAVVSGMLSYRAGMTRRGVEASPRHWIGPVDVEFAHVGERVLSMFARPGADVVEAMLPVIDDAFLADFREALDRPVMADDGDGEDAVELKRMVAGLKQEAKTLLRGGNDVGGVISFFVQRQKMERALRRQIVEGVEAAPAAERAKRVREVGEMLATLGLEPIAEK